MRLSDAVASMNIASLVPAAYRAYRPLVVDALGYFLDRLSPERQAKILQQQLALGADTDLALRVTRLLAHCPTLHKLGQVLARDHRLAPALRHNLQRLETAQPSVPLADLLPVIRSETGETSAVSMERRPLAEASVAVIVPFTWRDPDRRVPIEGVFKVLKPDVVEHLEEELAIWPGLGEFLEERSARDGLAPVSYRELASGIALRLVNEVRLEREQKHLARAFAFYEDDPRIVVPRLLPMSTPRMTAMQRIHGVKITDVQGATSHRHALASLLADALIARPFWDRHPTATFHADPHAGNLLATEDGRLAILDWSLVASLDAVQRSAIMKMVLGALCLDTKRVHHAAQCLVIARHGESIGHLVENAVREVSRGSLPGFEWLTALLDRLATSGSVSFSEDLIMFRKALVSLVGVLRDLAPGRTIDRVLATTGMARFLGEVSGRTLSTDVTERFGTHLSNAELVEFWTAFSMTPARLWFGGLQETLRPGRTR